MSNPETTEKWTREELDEMTSDELCNIAIAQDKVVSSMVGFDIGLPRETYYSQCIKNGDKIIDMILLTQKKFGLTKADT